MESLSLRYEFLEMTKLLTNVVLGVALLAALVYTLWRVWFWLVPAPWAVWLGVGAVVINLAIAAAWVLRR